MKILDPGHYFQLNVLDAEQDCPGEFLRFVKREGPGYPGNVGHHGGTTMQEVLRALISRANYVNDQIQDRDTEEAIHHMTQAVFYLEARAAQRHRRDIDFSPVQAVTEPTCVKCGHIHCDGNCSEHHNNALEIFPVIVNGRTILIGSGTIPKKMTYEDIVALTLNNVADDNMKVQSAFGVLFTITFQSDDWAGSITKGQSVQVYPGMKFDVVYTGAA